MYISGTVAMTEECLVSINNFRFKVYIIIMMVNIVKKPLACTAGAPAPGSRRQAPLNKMLIGYLD